MFLNVAQMPGSLAWPFLQSLALKFSVEAGIAPAGLEYLSTDRPWSPLGLALQRPLPPIPPNSAAGRILRTSSLYPALQRLLDLTRSSRVTQPMNSISRPGNPITPAAAILTASLVICMILSKMYKHQDAWPVGSKNTRV